MYCCSSNDEHSYTVYRQLTRRCYGFLPRTGKSSSSYGVSHQDHALIFQGGKFMIVRHTYGLMTRPKQVVATTHEFDRSFCETIVMPIVRGRIKSALRQCNAKRCDTVATNSTVQQTTKTILTPYMLHESTMECKGMSRLH